MNVRVGLTPTKVEEENKKGRKNLRGIPESEAQSTPGGGIEGIKRNSVVYMGQGMRQLTKICPKL